MKSRLAVIKKGILFALKEYNDARIMTNAATITLFMFISVFPMAMIILTIIPHIPMLNLGKLLAFLSPLLPSDIYQTVSAVLVNIYAKTAGGSALSLTILTALWSASSGVSWLGQGIIDVYRSPEKRSWVSLKLLSLLYTVVFVFVIILTLLFIVFGQAFQQMLAETYPDISFFQRGFRSIGNLTALVSIDLFVTLLYKVYPKNKGNLAFQVPGILTATIGWFLFSKIYACYLNSVKGSSYMYGSLAVIVSTIIWIFVCMNIVLIGAEVNYLCRKAFDKGKAKHERNQMYRKRPRDRKEKEDF